MSQERQVGKFPCLSFLSHARTFSSPSSFFFAHAVVAQNLCWFVLSLKKSVRMDEIAWGFSRPSALPPTCPSSYLPTRPPHGLPNVVRGKFPHDGHQARQPVLFQLRLGGRGLEGGQESKKVRKGKKRGRGMKVSPHDMIMGNRPLRFGPHKFPFPCRPSTPLSLPPSLPPSLPFLLPYLPLARCRLICCCSCC